MAATGDAEFHLAHPVVAGLEDGVGGHVGWKWGGACEEEGEEGDEEGEWCGLHLEEW